ncbi:FAD dependent oxidoreductase [Azorhizobium caulinodans ORS 571]|uniref:FAD dependent oxidoreductase n=1 Tax=Azorhizobium caulinodans (strain ATCC 43989 / DSM 5975 / JCM 20966 / LMG 6465 / NBRC 14845 / NCIMB 13405 / ORS 571) TaxID=438753 RepID=A8IA76_AZOC5|nr:FAD-binding oxidoreductase [Azorhizobium caulinodans]BAF88472.1 FAD dependent oxidoreductase [Azorhizobium caulinodans ORS 571]
MASPSSDIVSALTALLGADSLLTEAADVAAHIEDWRERYRGPAACVVLPRSTQEVSDVVRLCHAHGVPVLPQGGNTSLCGGAVPGTDGQPPVIVALSRLRRIRSVDPANNAMVVDGGCVLANVQEAAREAGRLYPISLGAEGSCQIAGTIATNAGGTAVLRYGNTRENILGLEAVLPDGAIWDGLKALRKNNTGYDLKHLFIGSEGTLGIITGATLKLHPLPTAFCVAWVGVSSPDAALSLLGRLQSACGARLSAFELINDLQLDLVLANVPGRRNPFSASHPWHVLVELSDNSPEVELSAVLGRVLEEAMEADLIEDAVLAASEAQRAALWEIRHSVSEANKKAGVGLTTDCAVPVSAVPTFIAQATEAVRAIVPDLPVIVVAHMGDGNAHFIPFFTYPEWEAVADKEAMAHRMRHVVNEVSHALGGTFSAEHGVGRTHIAEMAHFKSPVELKLMHAVKAAFDPDNLFNPGRLLPPAA